MNKEQIPICVEFRELFQPSRYKAFYGGRGGAKSQSFARALVIKAMKQPLRILCCREIQKSIKDSVKRLFDDLIAEYKLESHFTSTDTEIRGSNGSLFIFYGLRSNPEQIKSMEAIDIAWVEEANTVSQRSLDLLIPTVRKEGSEIWFSWNPKHDFDPVDMMFRGEKVPPKTVMKKVLYSDNPFLPSVLNDEAEFMKEKDYNKYAHIWLGEYDDLREGAYFTEQIQRAITEKRITKVMHDESVEVWTAWDIGFNDSTAIWFFQFIGNEIRVIDYLENNKKPIDWYARKLKEKPYTYAPLVLPHDAYNKSVVSGKSVADMLKDMGFNLMYDSNKSAPRDKGIIGVNLVRSIFNRLVFDADNCKGGLKALKNYYEGWDEDRNVSKGAVHDWSSHGTKAFIYMAMTLESPRFKRQDEDIEEYKKAAQAYVNHEVSTGWEPDFSDVVFVKG